MGLGIWVVLLLLTSLSSCCSTCSLQEQNSLLDFKQGIDFTYYREYFNELKPLESWRGLNWYSWEGVVCHQHSAHVITLDLSHSGIVWSEVRGGPFQLLHLEHLDLSYNTFYPLLSIPPQIGELRRLKYLSLSHCGFVGQIPRELTQLQQLERLDLRGNFLHGVIPREIGNISTLKFLDLSLNHGLQSNNLGDWITHLRGLEHLGLRSVNLTMAKGYLLSLVNLTALDMQDCRLSGEIPPFFGNLSRLQMLELQGNSFRGKIPAFLGALPLSWLNLSWNNLEGSIPSSLSGLSNLEHLDLSSNKLNGSILPTTVKDIHEQALKQLLPNLSDDEVKADLKKHEGKMFLRFHTCLVLINDIELVVRDVRNMWKNIYHLHEPSKPSKNLVEIKDDNSSDEEDDTPNVAVTVDDYEELMKDDDKEKEEEDEKEEDDPVRIAAQVIASLPHSPLKVSTSSGLKLPTEKVITSTADTLSVGSLFATSQLLATTMEVSTTSSTELQTSPSTSAMSTCTVSLPSISTVLTTLVLSTIPESTSVVNTLVLDSIDTSVSLLPSTPIQVCSISSTISTVVSITKSKDTVSEVKPWTPLKLLITSNLPNESINLDMEIIIPNLDLDSATIEEMRLVSQLLEKKAKQKQLRIERDREFSIIENAKNIIAEAIGVDVDSSQHILLQLQEAVKKFHDDSSGKEKLLEMAIEKFENKVLEHIAQHIALNQAELLNKVTIVENSLSKVTAFFVKLCDIDQFTKEIKGKINKIEIDIKDSVQQLMLDPSTSSTHLMHLQSLSDMQTKLSKEEARIQYKLIEIQNMILPIMDTMQKHIAHSKTLVHDNNLSDADHLIKLSAQVQVSLHTDKAL